MTLRKSVILRRPRSGRLEGRTALIQPTFDSFTDSYPPDSRPVAAAFIQQHNRERFGVISTKNQSQSGGSAAMHPHRTQRDYAPAESPCPMSCFHCHGPSVRNSWILLKDSI